MAYLTDDGSDYFIHRVRFDQTQPETVFVDTVATSVSHLELLGSLAVYVRRVGTQDQLVLVDMLAATPVAIVVDTAATIGLADDRPAGSVYLRWVRGTPPSSSLWACLLDDDQTPGVIDPSTPWPVVSPGAPSEVVSSGSGWQFAHVARAAGLTDVYFGPEAYPARNLTNSTDGDWVIEQLAISRTGEWVTFVSNGDFAGLNLDESFELFRVSTSDGTIQQVTELIDPSLLYTFRGNTIDGSGITILHSLGLGANTHVVVEEDFGYVEPDTFAFATGLVAPPFDVSFPATPCMVNGNDVTCTAFVRNSWEGVPGEKRGVLVFVTWDSYSLFTCSHEERPALFALVPTGKQFTLTDTFRFDCHGATGTFSVRIVQPDVTQADLAESTTGFTF